MRREDRRSSHRKSVTSIACASSMIGVTGNITNMLGGSSADGSDSKNETNGRSHIAIVVMAWDNKRAKKHIFI